MASFKWTFMVLFLRLNGMFPPVLSLTMVVRVYNYNIETFPQIFFFLLFVPLYFPRTLKKNQMSSALVSVSHPAWTIKVPSSVKGLLGSCVVVPCSYDYPDPGVKRTGFTGMWLDDSNRRVVHSAGSNVSPQYLNRTKLTGKLSEKQCSLEIDPLQQSDQGPFAFRIEIAKYNQFSYYNRKVSISTLSKYIYIFLSYHNSS